MNEPQGMLARKRSLFPLNVPDEMASMGTQIVKRR